MLLDEVILGGEILETSKHVVRAKMQRVEKLIEKEKGSWFDRMVGDG